MKILKNVIYDINNIVIEKTNNGITLIKNDIVIEDLFEIIIFIIKNEKKLDKSILDIEITLADKKNSNILNLIYQLSGGDNVQKNNHIQKKEQNDMSEFFLNNIDFNVKTILKNCKTLKDLKDKINNTLSCEYFYELGLKHNLINEIIDITL